MDFDRINSGHSLHNLRRALPLSAHARPALLSFLRARGAIGRTSPRLTVIDVFDAGAAGGLMCRFAVAEDGDGSCFIAPLAQIALERKHPAARSCVERRRQAPPPGAA